MTDLEIPADSCMVRLLIHTTVFLAVLGTSYGIARPKGIEMGLWGAVVSVPGGDLPFGLELRGERGRAEP